MSLIITLIFIGLILLIAELLIIPGFGVAGILGLASILGSIYLAFTQFGQTTGLIVLGVVIMLTLATTVIILRSKTWKNISLKESIKSKVSEHPESRGLKVGNTGVTLSRISPMGKARFNGSDFEVSSIQGVIDNGREVEIVQIEDSKIIVKQINR